jgi:glutaconyl-CoA/methylmalonyl-CoA decarboxylase subunit delta
MILLEISNFGNILLNAAIGITVVFLALTILVFAFSLTGKLSKKNTKLKLKKSRDITSVDIEKTIEPELSGQEIAAISMALHLFFTDIHDEESNVITIKRIERRYSPWNSKIYGLTNLIR